MYRCMLLLYRFPLSLYRCTLSLYRCTLFLLQQFHDLMILLIVHQHTIVVQFSTLSYGTIIAISAQAQSWDCFVFCPGLSQFFQGLYISQIEHIQGATILGCFFCPRYTKFEIINSANCRNLRQCTKCTEMSDEIITT